MNNNKNTKAKSGFLKSALFRTLCILLSLTVLTALSVGIAYARFVTSSEDGDSAGVASMGVTEFRLSEHEAELITDNDEIIRLNKLYKLKDGKDGSEHSEVAGNTYGKVMPGVDIDKDPFIVLKIDSSEVNFELYIEVEETNFPTYTYTDNSDPTDPKKVTVSAITYTLTEDWTPVLDEQGNAIKGRYKFVGNYPGVKNGIFMAGTQHNFSEAEGKSVIKILQDDKLTVSQYYDSDLFKSFSLTFTPYLTQTLDGASGN